MPTKAEIMDSLGTHLDGKIVDQLVSNGKVASATLLNSITHTVRETLKGIEVTGTMVSYGKYVNNGRKPGTFVPIQQLMDWIRLKGIENDLVKAKSIAIAISKTIKLKGIKPLPFIENAVTESLVEIDRRVEQASREDVERELDIIFQIV